MESQYNPHRTLNIFSPLADKPYQLSRSKINDYLKCPRCFYIDRRLGTGHPPSYAYTLNNAVDALLKKEFDIYRAKAERHPKLIKHGIDAIPFCHPNLEGWRMNQRGIKFHHLPTNFIVTGAIDDVWINANNELIIVDYKATSTSNEITLDNRESYKKQMEIYQWLFRQNGFTVSTTGYFFFCNGDAAQDSFSGLLSFQIFPIAYRGDDSWVEATLYKIKDCLVQDNIPPCTETCDYCNYWAGVNRHTTSVSGLDTKDSSD